MENPQEERAGKGKENAGHVLQRKPRNMSRKSLFDHRTTTIRALIEQAESAPSVEVHNTVGFNEPRHIIPVTPGSVGTVSLDGEALPAATAAAALGINYQPLAPNSVGQLVKMSHLVAKHSRFCEAGGNLVLANKNPRTTQAGGDPDFYLRPQRLRLIKPAVFSLLGDGLEVAEQPYPADELEVKIGDAANYSIRFQVSRRAQKSLDPALLAYEIALSVSRGVANLVDKIMLEAIIAAAPGAFSLGTLAGKDVRIDELRAIVGTNAAGVTWRGDGAFTAGNIPAELSPVVAETVAGAFGRAFVVLSDETRIVMRRNDVLGTLDVLCHVNVKPGVVDAHFFGTVA